ncbi:hypothetical protein BH24ACT11_BH24ACT11_17830 [soil metagenome]
MLNADVLEWATGGIIAAAVDLRPGLLELSPQLLRHVNVARRPFTRRARHVKQRYAT